MAGEQANKQGIVATLSDLGDGTSSFVFDDVRLDADCDSPRWLFQRPYTQTEYPNEALDALALAPEDYRMIGENLVFRLLALNGRMK